jgi:hypothetical protein
MRAILRAAFMATALGGCITAQESAQQASVARPASPAKPDISRLDALKTKAAGPWRHAPQPVTVQQLEKDKARCRVEMAKVPLNPLNSSAVIEIRLYSFFIDCMEAKGYVAP